MNEESQKSLLSDRELQEQLNPLGEKVKVLGISIVITVVAAIIFAIALQLSEEHSATYYTLAGSMVALIVLAGVLIIPLVKTQNEIEKLVGGNITKGVLAEVFESMEYDPAGRIGESIMESTGLIDGWNWSSGNDYVKGKYKGYDIMFCDAHLEHVKEKRDSDGEIHEKRQTIFKGPWIILEHDRELTLSLRIKERLSSKKNRKIPEGLEIETENVDFNTQFQILSCDGQTAFQILTPHFMEFIISSDVKAHGNTFMCFDSNKIHIAIHNDRDSLETSNTQLKDVIELRRHHREELKYLTNILDELMQNNYLFKGHNGGIANG